LQLTVQGTADHPVKRYRLVFLLIREKQNGISNSTPIWSSRGIFPTIFRPNADGDKKNKYHHLINLPRQHRHN
jgi:hypothetical protein